MNNAKNFKKRSGIKLFAVIFAVSMLVFGIIGTSLAWLMTSSDPIVNVFTYGDIDIKLEETTGEEYKMVPGKTLSKNPALTVIGGSEDCWLFVKIEESTNVKLSDYIEYAVANGWTALDGVAGVYYREVTASDDDQVFGILLNDQVKVKTTVTKDMFNNLNDSNYPKLTFTGYAVQRAEINSAAEAWDLIANG